MYRFQAILFLPNLAKVTSEPYVFAIPIPATWQLWERHFSISSPFLRPRGLGLGSRRQRNANGIATSTEPLHYCRRAWIIQILFPDAGVVKGYLIYFNIPL
jgi:hypothetical protein